MNCRNKKKTITKLNLEKLNENFPTSRRYSNLLRLQPLRCGNGW